MTQAPDLTHREGIDAALAADPYYIPALLARGRWFEENNNVARAATDYRNALKICPPESHWPAEFRPQLLHARLVAEQVSGDTLKHLQSELSDLTEELPPALAERWQEAMSIRAGRSQPYISQSNQLHVPRLPSIPFFDRADFPFLDALEARTTEIRAELEQVLAEERDEFTPYIAYEPGQPVNQWQELDHSDRWSALHLWTGGVANEKNLARCPVTREALEEIALADIDGVCPNVLFSALAPRTHIPPHNGECNARLVAHLPLIIPENCRYRVGFEWREWEVGKCLVFDDTIEHEAINDSDELRVVLIFDLWNPLLTETEKKLVSRMAASMRQFGTSPE